MKKFVLIAFVLSHFFHTPMLAQNVGIGTTTPGSKLQVKGSFAPNYTEVTTTPYTISDNDYFVVFNGGFAAGTFTLPAGAEAMKGRNYFIKNGAVNALTIKAASSETIDGDTAIMLSPGEVAHIIMKGTSGSSYATSEVVAVTAGSYQFFNAGLAGRPWNSKGNTGTTPDNNFIGTNDRQDFVTRTYGSEKMRVTSDGKVGIGTSAPSGTLQVQSNSGIAGLFISTVRGPSDTGVLHAEYKGTEALDKAAVYGRSIPTHSDGIGVRGVGGRTGVEGFVLNSFATDNAGVRGVAVGDNDFCYGVYGVARSNTYNYGTKIGVYGKATGGYLNYAAFFDGDAQVNGTIRASGAFSADGHGFIGNGLNMNGNLLVGGTKSFRIDHPTDPENKYLYHYCIESNEVLNVYSGNITTGAAGLATIELPAYFESINKDFRYQLTVVGDFAQAIIKKKIADNSFVIQTSKPNLEVSWMVTAVRNDKYMQAHPAKTEVEKEAVNKGKYLQPIEWNQPESKAIGDSQNNPAEKADKASVSTSKLK